MHLKSLTVIASLSLLITSVEGVFAGKTKRERELEKNACIIRAPILEDVQVQPPAQRVVAVEEQRGTSFPLLMFGDNLIIMIMQYEGVAKALENVCRRTEHLRTHPNVPLCTVFKTRESLEEFFTTRRKLTKQHIKYNLLHTKHIDAEKNSERMDFHPSDCESLGALLYNLKKYQYPLRSLTFKYTPELFQQPELTLLSEAKIPEIYFDQMQYSQLPKFRATTINLCGIKHLSLTSDDLVSMSNTKFWDQKPFNNVVGIRIEDAFTHNHVPFLNFGRRLRGLSFLDCQLTDLGFAMLLPRLPSLTRLLIEPTEIARFTDETAQIIATTVPMLEVLDIPNITRDGVKNLSNLTKLRMLWLNECGLDDSCAPAIGKLVSLTYLDLSFNNFTNACFQHFLSLRFLEAFEIQGNHVSTQGLYQFSGMIELSKKLSKLTKTN